MSASQDHSQKTGPWMIIRSSLIALFILVVAIDTIPAVFGVQKKLQEIVEPALDKLGLWQGSWELFAPEPLRINTAIRADIKLADGTVLKWTSQNPATYSLWEKFRNFRWSEYYDTVRLDDYGDAWPPLADWIAKDYGSENNRVIRVRLYRSWVMLNEQTLANKEPFPFLHRYMIYQKEYPSP
jgi:hypothetical protein